MSQVLPAVLALVAAAALLFPPGYAAVRIVWPNGDLWARLALATPVAVGISMTWATVLDRVLHLPVSPWTMLPVAWALPIVLGLLLSRGRPVGRHGHSLYSIAAERESDSRADRFRERIRRPDVWDVGMLAVGVVTTLIIWLRSTDSLTRIPGNDDGTHHVMWTVLIAQRQTIDPSVITIGDIATNSPAAAFYPLGIHLQAALIHRTFGIDAALAAVSFPVLWSMLVLPLGTYVVLRALTRSGHRLPAAAAALVAMSSQFPWSVPGWGGFALIGGYSLIPAVVAGLVLLSLDPLGKPLRAGIALGLAGIGIFFVHSSGAAAVAVYAVAVVPYALLSAQRRWGGPGPLTATSTLAVAAGSAALVLLPWRGALAAGSAERADFYDPGSPPQVSWWILRDVIIGPEWSTPVHVQWVIAVLTAVGVLTVIMRATAWPWFVGGALLLLLYWMVADGWSVARALSSPWYSQRFRLGLHLHALLMPLLALGLVTLATPLKWLAPQRWRPLVLGAAVTAATVVVVQLSYEPARYTSQVRVNQAWAQTSQGDAAYRWLAANVRPGERVLNDFSQGSAWMYVRGGTNPVYASKPEPFMYPNAFGDRMRLLLDAGQVGVDPSLTAVADRWNVRYAYVGAGVSLGHTIFLSTLLLDSSPGWRRVFTDGLAVVYERVG